MLSRTDIIDFFGKAGSYFYDVVRGRDDRTVVSHRERKSIGAERTYETDHFDIEVVKEKAAKVAAKAPGMYHNGRLIEKVISRLGRTWAVAIDGKREKVLRSEIEIIK